MPLTDAQWVALAEGVPVRSLNVALHEYVAEVRRTVDGDDPLNIPPTHADLMAAENHEGSQALNTRIRQLATWFAKGEPRVRAVPSGPGELVQAAAARIDRFVREGERAFARGVPLHNYKQECARDLAECGFAVYIQTPRKDYYNQADPVSEQMAEGTALLDLVLRRRIDPATFSFTEEIGGKVAEFVITSDRHLGELASRIGDAQAKVALDQMKLSEAIDVNNSGTWEVSVSIAEAWTKDEGALIFMGAGSGSSVASGVDMKTLGAEKRILLRWVNIIGRTSCYIAMVGPQPWHSPLDQMYALTNLRNHLATMRMIQAGGAAYRHWQLIDKSSGADAMDVIPRDHAPQHVLYDLSKPPPDMGANTEWILAPFEFQPGLEPMYMQMRADHEAAGSSVARLSGQVINQNTPVGTADFIDDAAQAEFGDWAQALDLQAQAAWADLLYYLRTKHKDAVYVTDKQRDRENDPTSFLSTTTSIETADIVTDTVEITTDRRSALSKLRDYRWFVEMQGNGHMEYETGVGLGLVPGVDDADAELDAIYVSQMYRAIMEARIHVTQQQELQALAPPNPDAVPPARPNVAGGSAVDPRGTGTRRGPGNISDSALAAGATDTARSA